MFEKVNPSHPDKLADRVAGAIVDLAYSIQKDPKIAVEVLIGHKKCHVIIESNVDFNTNSIIDIVDNICGKDVVLDLVCCKQDEHLAQNQKETFRCGDNGIFKGVPISREERFLTNLAKEIYKKTPYDGKYIINDENIIICQSNAEAEDIIYIPNVKDSRIIINPLGYWTGGTDVDTGATNRKLGSDMGRCVTGGGLHGKDLSKADVSVNIYAFLKAQHENKEIELSCAIGDEYIDGRPYWQIVEIARAFIMGVGGFEKFAEWGLIR